MSRGPDPGTALVRALEANAKRAGCPVRLNASDWTRWASATFTGTRHSLTLTAAASPRLDRWLMGLSEAEFALRNYLLADLVVTRMCRDGDRVTVTLEALTVEER